MGCSKGHPLKWVKASHDRIMCDLCSRIQNKGSWIKSCDGCGYDLCLKCSNVPKTTAKSIGEESTSKVNIIKPVVEAIKNKKRSLDELNCRWKKSEFTSRKEAASESDQKDTVSSIKKATAKSVTLKKVVSS